MKPHMPPHHDQDDTKRLIVLMFIIGLGMIAWHFMFEAPRQQAEHRQRVVEYQKQQAAEKQKALEIAESRERVKEQVKEIPTIAIQSDLVDGTISLRGGRINYLKLLNYKETPKEGSDAVTLLRPAGGMESYFVEFGWLSQDKDIILPNSDTIWQTTDSALTKDQPATLFWENSQGIRFETAISLKDDYLFAISQRVINRSGKQVSVVPYGFINRTFEGKGSEFFILHEGPVGVWEDSLHEISYDDLRDDQKVTLSNAEGWLGITDKYWLTALIPAGHRFTGHFKYYTGQDSTHRYQADYMGSPIVAADGTTASYDTLVFAGAKKLKLLDRYAQEYNIPLFDRAVDLGWLYFLTKPLFILLNWLYAVAGDFGLAIILLTVIIKLAMYPLANKSYVSMNEMKRLQPKMTKLKERYGDDRVKFNQELMAIYKKEKINPAAGCLPLIIQIPVFFALYKVLFVTIEMRHANFFGIIHDLSAKDPTNIFNLFGLIDWTPPDPLHLGIMPILMALTMWGQQQLNPKPTDPTQAKVMGWLPWIFMLILAGFPAGLLLYWIWSNILSILQQWSIKRRYEKREKKRERALNAQAANDS